MLEEIEDKSYTNFTLLLNAGYFYVKISMSWYIILFLVHNFTEVINLKIFLSATIIALSLIAENKCWYSIMDLSIDNNCNAIKPNEIEEIEDVNVKFRTADLINYVEKLLK